MRRTIENDSSNKHTSGWKMLGGLGITLILAGGGAYDVAQGVKIYQNHQQTVELKQNNHKLQNENDRLQAKLAKRKLIVAQNSSVLTPVDQQNIQLIKQSLQTQYTYTSAKEYMQNWQNLHQSIIDSNYFKQFYTNSLDATGNSMIGALNQKSLCTNVQVYKAPNNQYLAIVTYVPYHNDNDLKQLSNLTPMTQGMIITCDHNQIATISPIPNWGMLMSND